LDDADGTDLDAERIATELRDQIELIHLGGRLDVRRQT
jgi:hypothetical protein